MNISLLPHAHVDLVVRTYQPDYLVCGHFHETPYTQGTGRERFFCAR